MAGQSEERLEAARARLRAMGAEPEPVTLWHHTLTDHEFAALAHLEEQRAAQLEALARHDPTARIA